MSLSPQWCGMYFKVFFLDGIAVQILHRYEPEEGRNMTKYERRELRESMLDFEKFFSRNWNLVDIKVQKAMKRVRAVKAKLLRTYDADEVREAVNEVYREIAMIQLKKVEKENARPTRATKSSVPVSQSAKREQRQQARRHIKKVRRKVRQSCNRQCYQRSPRYCG